MRFAPQWRAIFHLSSGQMTPRPPLLASLLFDPPEPQNIGKTQCFATFLPFRAPASSFFWLFLFSDFLSSSLLFSSLSLPTSAFSSVHVVRSLTSKLPSTLDRYSDHALVAWQHSKQRISSCSCSQKHSSAWILLKLIARHDTSKGAKAVQTRATILENPMAVARMGAGKTSFAGVAASR